MKYIFKLVKLDKIDSDNLWFIDLTTGKTHRAYKHCNFISDSRFEVGKKYVLETQLSNLHSRNRLYSSLENLRNRYKSIVAFNKTNKRHQADIEVTWQGKLKEM